jgi:hypothetical protein
MNIGALSRRHTLPTSYRADKRTAENWASLRPERHPVFVSGRAAPVVREMRSA